LFLLGLRICSLELRLSPEVRLGGLLSVQAQGLELVRTATDAWKDFLLFASSRNSMVKRLLGTVVGWIDNIPWSYYVKENLSTV
jgi:hypothetical protein